MYVRALDVLLHGKMAKLVVERDFELLAEVSKLAQQDAPYELAVTDPALYASWRAAVTRFHVAGWTQMTPERVLQVANALRTKNPAQDNG